MKSTPVGLVATVLCVWATSAVAQSTRPATNAAPRRATPPLVSPEVQRDGGVTFRFRAPKAAEVKVAGQLGADAAMSKDDQGLWSVTLPKVLPGVYEYRFVVDGLSVIDPQNSQVKPQRWPGVSILHISANPPAPWTSKTFRTVRFMSTPTYPKPSTPGAVSWCTRRLGRKSWVGFRCCICPTVTVITRRPGWRTAKRIGFSTR